jgi:hypothetical protein
MAAVWGRTVVENANLTVQISALRRVLDKGSAGPSCIATVAARGYRFSLAVVRVTQGENGADVKPADLDCPSIFGGGSRTLRRPRRGACRASREIKLKPEVNSLVAWQIYRPWETNPEYLALCAKTLDVGLHQALIQHRQPIAQTR